MWCHDSERIKYAPILGPPFPSFALFPGGEKTVDSYCKSCRKQEFPQRKGGFQYPEMAVSQRKSLMPLIFRPQFWGRKWLRQFYGRLAFFGSFCRNTPMPIKFLFLGGGGGVLGFLCQFYFYGRGDFLNRGKNRIVSYLLYAKIKGVIFSTSIDEVRLPVPIQPPPTPQPLPSQDNAPGPPSH